MALEPLSSETTLHRTLQSTVNKVVKGLMSLLSRGRVTGMDCMISLKGSRVA